MKPEKVKKEDKTLKSLKNLFKKDNNKESKKKGHESNQIG